MTEFENNSKLFEKIVQDYETQLKDASYQFQATVMAAQHEMEQKILKWTNDLKEKSDVKEEP